MPAVASSPSRVPAHCRAGTADARSDGCTSVAVPRARAGANCRAAALIGLTALAGAQAQTPPSQYFPETGHSISGRFLEYWRTNGGLAVFGYPLTDERNEGERKVQYFAVSYTHLTLPTSDLV